MGKSNFQAGLEKKFASWSGKLIDIQRQIAKIEESHTELDKLRSRAQALEGLIDNAKSIFLEVNPSWDPEAVKPSRSNVYKLPFVIGTISKDSMTILRESNKSLPSREIAKLIMERNEVADKSWEMVDRITSAVDACMRSRRNKYVKGEGEYPIYWSILD
jgi:hypothetical protein